MSALPVLLELHVHVHVYQCVVYNVKVIQIQGYSLKVSYNFHLLAVFTRFSNREVWFCQLWVLSIGGHEVGQNKFYTTTKLCLICGKLFCKLMLNPMFEHVLNGVHVSSLIIAIITYTYIEYKFDSISDEQLSQAISQGQYTCSYSWVSWPVVESVVL